MRLRYPDTPITLELINRESWDVSEQLDISDKFNYFSLKSIPKLQQQEILFTASP